MDIELINDSAPELLLDVEREVLSVAINSPKASFEILSKLTPEDFSSSAHSDIYIAISQLSQTGKIVSITTISDLLDEQKKLDKVGGIVYLSQISGYFYTDEGIEGLLEVVFKHSMARQLDRALKDIKAMRDNKIPLQEVFMRAQEKILNIKTEMSKDDAEHVRITVRKVIEHIEELEKKGTEINGVPAGYQDLDAVTNGWQKGDFIILAARPSMGKTAFALNLAWNAARQDKGVAFFSLEMPKEQLVQRMLSSVSKIESHKLRTAEGLTPDTWSRLTGAADNMGTKNIVIDDTPGLSVLQIQSKLRKMVRDFNVEVCFIDYLQLISAINTRGDSRQNEVAAISRQLKQIARELNIPIICLSQLSRSVEQRENKEPIMSDLRDSGAIEQDADIIMFLYREAYYDKKDFSETEVSESDLTKVIMSKHRNGATGKIDLLFYKAYGRFTDKND